MIYRLLDILGFEDNVVQIGVSPQMSKQKRHGVVHYDTQNGIRHIGFLADKPKRIDHRDSNVVNKMFRQLDLLGIPAVSIEVKVLRGVRIIKRSSASLAAARLRAL